MTPRFSTTLLRAQSDQRLVELVHAGHEAAFTTIVERYRPQLHRYARRMLPESRCEDAVQQAFMQAWRALQDGKDVRQLRPWLYTIVHNASVNQLRQGVFDYRELLDTVQGNDDPCEDVQRLAVMRQTLAAVAALPERQRDALLAVVVAGRPQSQVADEMGLTENGLRQLLFRARSTLRSAATAVTPLPLLMWAARAPQTGGAGFGTRIGEAAAGAGAVAGGAHVLQTGTALIVAGTLAVGGATALEAPHSATAQHTTTLAAVVKADPASAPVRLHAGRTHVASRRASTHAGTKHHASSAPDRVLLAGGHGFRVAPLPAVTVAPAPEVVVAPAPKADPVAQPAPAPATTAPALAALPASPTAGPTPAASGHGGGDDHGSGTTNSSQGSSGQDGHGGDGGGNDGGGGSGSSPGGSGSAPTSGGDSHSGPGPSGSGSGSSSGSSGSSSTSGSSDSHSDSGNN